VSDLPAGWTLARLEQCCEVILGQSPPSDTYNESGVGLPFFQGKAEFGPMHPVAMKWCSAPTKVAQPDDVLVSVRAPVGPTNIANLDCGIGRGLAALRPRPHVRPKWVLYGVRATEQRLRSRATGSTFEAVSGSQLRAHTLPLPLLDEQDRIIAEIEKQFTRLDAAVAGLGRIRAALRAYRSAVLRAAIMGRLVRTEAALAREQSRSFESGHKLLERLQQIRTRYVRSAVPPPHDLPEGWAWASADMVGDILLGRQRAPQYLTGEHSHPYLRVANVKDDSLDLSDLEEMDFDPTHFEKYRVRPGDILLSEGQSPHLVGQSAIYRGGIDGLCFQKTLHRFRPIEGGPSSEFAQIVFRGSVKSGVYKRIASITTNIAHLTLEKFKSSPFPLPPASEQERIVSEVERVMSITSAVERAIETQEERAKALRQSVLGRAFEGKLVANGSSSVSNVSGRPEQGAEASVGV
jgi:type I restriction enzyme S subunit